MATYTLKMVTDAVTGTLGDDTFDGIYDGAATDTFNNDVIDGNGGIDTLNITHATGAIMPSDALWAGISKIKKVVITARQWRTRYCERREF